MSFTVCSTNAQPVVVERAMWWREAAGRGPWVESHASAGATAGAAAWGYVVSAAARLTLDLAAEFPRAVGGTSSLTISGSGAVVASRYWDAVGLQWGAGANLRATPLP